MNRSEVFSALVWHGQLKNYHSSWSFTKLMSEPRSYQGFILEIVCLLEVPLCGITGFKVMKLRSEFHIKCMLQHFNYALMQNYIVRKRQSAMVSQTCSHDAFLDAILNSLLHVIDVCYQPRGIRRKKERSGCMWSFGVLSCITFLVNLQDEVLYSGGK